MAMVRDDWMRIHNDVRICYATPQHDITISFGLAIYYHLWRHITAETGPQRQSKQHENRSNEIGSVSDFRIRRNEMCIHAGLHVSIRAHTSRKKFCLHTLSLGRWLQLANTCASSPSAGSSVNTPKAIHHAYERASSLPFRTKRHSKHAQTWRDAIVRRSLLFQCYANWFLFPWDEFRNVYNCI